MHTRSKSNIFQPKHRNVSALSEGVRPLPKKKVTSYFGVGKRGFPAGSAPESDETSSVLPGCCHKYGTRRATSGVISQSRKVSAVIEVSGGAHELAASIPKPKVDKKRQSTTSPRKDGEKVANFADTSPLVRQKRVKTAAIKAGQKKRSRSTAKARLPSPSNPSSQRIDSYFLRERRNVAESDGTCSDEDEVPADLVQFLFDTDSGVSTGSHDDEPLPISSIEANQSTEPAPDKDDAPAVTVFAETSTPSRPNGPNKHTSGVSYIVPTESKQIGCCHAPLPSVVRFPWSRYTQYVPDQ